MCRKYILFNLSETMKGALKEKKIKKTITDNDNAKILVLYNDDYHTFEYVIEALIEICKHDYTQAEQCAMITHFKGKCDVKHGAYNELKSMKDQLIERELKVAIE